MQSKLRFTSVTMLRINHFSKYLAFYKILHLHPSYLNNNNNNNNNKSFNNTVRTIKLWNMQGRRLFKFQIDQ